MRDEILAQIKRIAQANGGRAPGKLVFERRTGIRTSAWEGKYWARWGDALTEAGYSPNQLVTLTPLDLIFKGLVGAIRHYGRMPSIAEIKMYRRSHPELPSHNTLTQRFGGKARLVEQLRSWIAEHSEHADVAPMLPSADEGASELLHVGDGKRGYVYLMRSGSHFKIGRSAEIERRIKEITLALPERVTLIHVIETDDPSGIEAYWHHRFAERRANGEWFSLTPQDVAAFRRRKFQ